jgi:hypothetical protein
VALPVHGSLARAGLREPYDGHGSRRLWIDPSSLRPAADCVGGPTHGRRLDGGGSPSVLEEGTPRPAQRGDGGHGDDNVGVARSLS